MIRTAFATVFVLAGSAVAQYEITIEVDNPVLRPGESTTVTMFAGFDPSDFAMAGLETSLVTSVGSEGWSGLALVAPMDGPGTSAGAAGSTGIDAIIAGQFHFPRHGFDADQSNPIAFWSATYTAPSDAAPMLEIRVSSQTARYDAYVSQRSELAEPRLEFLNEGAATITVVPAPASALVLAGGLLAAHRRRP